MRDVDIRPPLRRWLSSRYCGQSDSLIVEELGLCQGSVRADFAVVNGVLKGFEIKSECDTLARLERQASIYSMIFDTVSLIVAERHLMAAKKIVPRWWGICAVQKTSGCETRIEIVRDEKTNSDVDPTALVQLLWRAEVIQILDAISPRAARSNRARRFLWAELISALSLSELREVTRTTLKQRRDWRADQAQMLHDARYQPFATLSDSLGQPTGGRSRRYSHRPN